MKVFGIAGWSGSGKTSLIERLIPEFAARGFSVSVIKHAHKGFQIDQPGKDSHRHRVAGASQVLLSGPGRWALVGELRGAEEPSLAECLRRLGECDLVLVEGFKRENIPMIEVHRPAYGRSLMAPEKAEIVAVATDGAVATALPILDLNATAAIAEFIVAFLAVAVSPPDPLAAGDGVSSAPFSVANGNPSS